MKIPPSLPQTEVDARFVALSTAGLSDDDTLRQLVREGLPMRQLWKTLAQHRGLERREAMKQALIATREVRDQPVQNSRELTFCPRCGAKLFFALPGKTTREEIVEFLSLIHPGTHEDWVHPGCYCPNGCFTALYNMAGAAPDTREKARAHRTAAITLHFDTSGPLPAAPLKVYLDRNVRALFPREEDQSPQDEITLFLEPGLHTLVVRDANHRATHRRESNLLEFHIEEDQHLPFLLSDTGGCLHLDSRSC